MEIFSGCLMTLMFVSGFLFIYVLFSIFIKWLNKEKLNKHVLEESASKKQNYYLRLARNGIKFLHKPCKFMLRKIKALKSFTNNIVKVLESKNIKSNNLAVLSVSISLSFFIFLIVSVITLSIIGGVAVVLLFWVCVFSYTKSYLEKQKNNLRNSVPDILRLMSSCFGAGYTMYQTFEKIAESTNNKISIYFKKCRDILQTGGSVHDALVHLNSNVALPEINFIALALDVQHVTGGSVKPIIESTKDMAESKLELIRMLHVKTAQAKLSSRIVTILPFVLLALFSILSPNFLKPFFSSLLGCFVFCIALIMQAAGIIIVRKMLEINI